MPLVGFFIFDTLSTNPMDENTREQVLTDETEVADFVDLVLSCEPEETESVLDAD